MRWHLAVFLARSRQRESQRAQSLVMLSHHLVGPSETVANEIRLAQRDPDAYISRNGFALTDREQPAATSSYVPWLVLVDAAVELGRACAIDPPGDARALALALGTLTPPRLHGDVVLNWIIANGLLAAPPPDLLRTLAVGLYATRGLVLAQISLAAGPDVLTVLTPQTYVRAVAAAAATGLGTIVRADEAQCHSGFSR